MEASVQRYIVPQASSYRSMFIEAFQLILFSLDGQPGPIEVTLYAPQNAVMHNIGPIEGLFSASNIGALTQGRVLQLTKGISLHFLSARSRNKHKMQPFVIAVLPTEGMLDELDQKSDLRAVVVIEDSRRDTEKWIRTWSPKISGEPQVEKSRSHEFDLDPIVRAALKVFLEAINLSHHALDKRSKEAARSVFWHLKKGGVNFDREEAGAFFARNGLKPEAARQASKIAEQILSRKTAPKPLYWPDDAIGYFRGRAEEE